MSRRFSVTAASCVVIFAILACNAPGSQNNSQPDLIGTITAQALALETATGQPAPVDTAAPGNTPLPANTAPPPNPPPPADTPKPASPSKPKNFKANGSATAIAFTWDDNSLNETGFRLYQDGVVAPIAFLDAHPATGGMSYNWSGLACGFKGNFSIRAYNDAGESGSSNSVDGVTIPCQPTNLIANASGNTISFNWAVVSPHNESGFRIYQQGVPGPVASRGPNLGSGGTIYDLTGLPCNLVATYAVRAFNSAGESPPTNLVQSESVPCGPSGFTITGASKDTVTYTWTDNATSETGYHIYRDDVLYVTLPAHLGTGTLGNDAFQSCGTTQVYSARAFNYAGESTTSEHVGATTLSC